MNHENEKNLMDFESKKLLPFIHAEKCPSFVLKSTNIIEKRWIPSKFKEGEAEYYVLDTEEPALFKSTMLRHLADFIKQEQITFPARIVYLGFVRTEAFTGHKFMEASKPSQ